jgi:lipoate-protein ligase A
MDVADREWRLVREEAWNGPTNMALDEVAAATAAAGGPRTLRVYRWAPSTLSLGYGQDPDSVDWTFCEREGVTVTRRPTGGGGIYHDSYGDLSYSIVAPAEELPGDLMEAYDLLCQPILEAFERMGVPAAFADEAFPSLYEPACYLREIHPAHDVLVDDRKVSGNAQYRRKDAVIQHGSLKFDVVPDRHLATFDEPAVPPGTFRDRVTTIGDHADTSREAAVRALETSLREWADADVGTWTPGEVERARRRAREKFATDAWTREREDPLSSHS